MLSDLLKDTQQVNIVLRHKTFSSDPENSKLSFQLPHNPARLEHEDKDHSDQRFTRSVIYH